MSPCLHDRPSWPPHSLISTILVVTCCSSSTVSDILTPPIIDHYPCLSSSVLIHQRSSTSKHFSESIVELNSINSPQIAIFKSYSIDFWSILELVSIWTNFWIESNPIQYYYIIISTEITVSDIGFHSQQASLSNQTNSNDVDGALVSNPEASHLYPTLKDAQLSPPEIRQKNQHSINGGDMRSEVGALINENRRATYNWCPWRRWQPNCLPFSGIISKCFTSRASESGRNTGNQKPRAK